MKKSEKVIESIAVIFLFVMLVLCLLQVFFRYVLEKPLAFTDEFARMAYIWMVFLMLPVLEARNEQIKVMYFFDKFSQRARVVLYWAMTAMYVAILVILCIGSWNMILSSNTITFGFTPWLIVSYQYIPMLIGALLSIPYVIYRAVHIKQVLKEAQDEFSV